MKQIYFDYTVYITVLFELRFRYKHSNKAYICSLLSFQRTHPLGTSRVPLKERLRDNHKSVTQLNITYRTLLLSFPLPYKPIYLNKTFPPIISAPPPPLLRYKPLRLFISPSKTNLIRDLGKEVDPKPVKKLYKSGGYTRQLEGSWILRAART